MTAGLEPLETSLTALDRIKLMRSIDGAEGVWLDWLAARLGLTRPATSDPSADPRFGFDDAGDPFDNQPFRGDAVNDSFYPLPDSLFRRLLRARAILILGDGTTATFGRAVRAIDDGAQVTDNRDMTVRIVTTQEELFELADSAGALPRTAGVLIIYADPERFGFDAAGQPFDNAPFRAS